MWYGVRLDAELGAVKFVVEVVERFHPGLVATPQNFAKAPIGLAYR
jgi:hypothetical protein